MRIWALLLTLPLLAESGSASAAVEVSDPAGEILKKLSAEPHVTALEFRRLLLTHQNAFSGAVRTVPDQQLERFLERLPQTLPKIQRVHAELTPARLKMALTRFRMAFPAFTEPPQFVTLFSFGQFDGQARPWNDGTAIFLGVDQLAAIHGAAPDALIFHEIFHACHYQAVPEIRRRARAFFEEGKLAPLYAFLWVEGLATYVSRQLAPDAPDRHVYPTDLAACRAHAVQIVDRALQHLTSEDPTVLNAFFYGSDPSAQLPPNAGYFLGDQIAQVLAQSFSLSDLGQLQGDRLLDEIARALLQLREDWLTSPPRQTAAALP